MTPADLAALHARAFAIPPPWPEAGFRHLIAAGAFLLTQPNAFLLGRVIADEAELLTIATDPASRRQGAGRALVEEFALEAAKRGAVTAFLEVASDNAPARALYTATGWQQAGRRRNYYAQGVDALVLTLDLTAKTG